MKTNKEWELACVQIEEYLKYNSIDIIDFYLVGSRVDNENSDSDFDSLIIIDNISNIEELKKLRQHLDTFIGATKISKLFHYKLFNVTELKLTASYDAFRLASFQKKHISIKKSAIISRITPILDEKSFINSFLIQLVYNFMCHYAFPDIQSIHKKLRFWIQFNLGIKELLPKNSVDFEHFINQDLLISNLWTYFHSGTWNKNKLQYLLKQYFMRLRHEYINKYETYKNIVLK